MLCTLRTLGTAYPAVAVGAARERVAERRLRAAVVYFIVNEGF
jgi:hypothetical protein